jgi:hypothetical protein
VAVFEFTDFVGFDVFAPREHLVSEADIGCGEKFPQPSVARRNLLQNVLESL